jgi:hypothetical protein
LSKVPRVYALWVPFYFMLEAVHPVETIDHNIRNAIIYNDDFIGGTLEQ